MQLQIILHTCTCMCTLRKVHVHNKAGHSQFEVSGEKLISLKITK